MNLSSYRIRYSVAAMIIVPLFGRLALSGTGRETELFRYLIPMTVGAFAGYFIGKFKDSLVSKVKELKELNSTLLKSKKNLIKNIGYLNGLMDNSPAVIYIKNISGKYLTVNKSFQELFGVSNREIFNKDDSYLFSKKKCALFRKTDERVIKTGAPITIDEEVIHDGVIHNYLTVKFPFRNARDRIIGIGGISWDMSEYRKVEEQLKQAQKMETIGILAGGFAHDFNNALTGIMGAVSLMNFKKDSGDLSSKKLGTYLNIIEDSSQRASNIVKKLMGISRKHDLSLEPLDLNKILKNLINIFESSLDKTVVLEVEYNKESANVLADSVQLQQAILNVLVNAGHSMTFMRDNSAKSGGCLNVSIKSYKADRFFYLFNKIKMKKEFWQITVKDRGIGIDKSILSKIFNPFFTTKSKEEGTGLGLSITYNIIKQHSGFIDIESEKDVGTTVKLFIPSVRERKRNGT
ncbi:MAG: PAS domain-containing protein [Spirochaetes bacterium]|nr:PAS domain-containing protein [Spirochaetota bacterium]